MDVKLEAMETTDPRKVGRLLEVGAHKGLTCQEAKETQLTNDLQSEATQATMGSEAMFIYCFDHISASG